MLRPHPVTFEEIQFQSLKMVETPEIAPAVSVVMPVMNGAAYIDKTLESLLSQGFTDFEVVVVDDASTDNTVEVVESFVKRDSRIKLFKNETNLGVAAAMNHAMSHARGQYIARVDADDLMLSNRLGKQFDCLESNPTVGIVGSTAYHMDENGKISDIYPQPPKDDMIRFQLLFMPAFYHPSCMYRKDVIVKQKLSYNPKIRVAEDLDFWQRMSMHCRMVNIKTPLIVYRKHTESISYRLKDKQRAEKVGVTLDYIMDRLQLPSKHTEKIEGLLGFIHFNDMGAHAMKDFVEAMDVIIRAFVEQDENNAGSSMRYKNMATKWLLKALASSDLPKGKKIRHAIALLVRPAYSLGFVAQTAKVAFWRTYWNFKKPNMAA